jgi:CheY-like chemotaxis protein/anti-sigma regulatory factor (Ser/Thr protein kinase)
VRTDPGDRAELVGVAGSGASDPGPAGSERVLLVDDREDNLMALEAVLEPLEFELIKATSGEEALRILLGTDVSAIVLDVQMPDMDGFETAALLKAREATSTIPVLFLTAVGLSLEHELRGYEVGGVDYICKPFEPKVLQAKVRAAVRWGSELATLRKASRVYQEATEALAAVRQPRPRPKRRRATAAMPVETLGEPIATTRCVDVGLEATVHAPAAARAAVRQALDSVPGAQVDIALLLVSELLANAVVHAGSDIRLRLDVGDRALRVEVEDAEPQVPDPVIVDASAEGGRGWLLVRQLSDRCGWVRLSNRKSVWFELGHSSDSASETTSG